MKTSIQSSFISSALGRGSELNIMKAVALRSLPEYYLRQARYCEIALIMAIACSLWRTKVKGRAHRTHTRPNVAYLTLPTSFIPTSGMGVHSISFEYRVEALPRHIVLHAVGSASSGAHRPRELRGILDNVVRPH